MTELDPLLSDSWTCTSWIKPFGFLAVQRKIDLGCQVVILEIQIFSHDLELRASLCLTLASGKFESWMLCNYSTQFPQAISSFICSCNLSNLSSKHGINIWVVHGAVEWIAKILFAEAPHRGVPQQNGHLMALESVFCMGGRQSDHHPISWFWKDLVRMTELLIKLSLLQLTSKPFESKSNLRHRSTTLFNSLHLRFDEIFWNHKHCFQISFCACSSF